MNEQGPPSSNKGTHRVRASSGMHGTAGLLLAVKAIVIVVEPLACNMQSSKAMRSRTKAASRGWEKVTT